MDSARPISRINPDILTNTDVISLRSAVKGDHIRNYATGLNDGIVCGRDAKGGLELITGESDGEYFTVKHQVISQRDVEEVEKLTYPCSGNSSVWVENARSKIGTKSPIADVTNASAFVMSCKRGGDKEWVNTYISQLCPGDHIKLENSTHCIVEKTILRLQEVHFITIGNEQLVHRQKNKDAYKYYKAVYNTSCTNKEALNTAVQLLGAEDSTVKFHDSERFAKHCKSGKIDTPLPINEATHMKYAPTARQYNPRVITGWQSKPLRDVLRGDHVHSTELGITHCIVEKKTGTILHCIGCIMEDGKLDIKRFTNDVISTGASLDVANYSSSKDSATAVKKALSLVGSNRASSFVDNEIDFVMLCKRGEEIEWESTIINKLERGDHITWGFNNRHHGIVQHVNTRRGGVMCFMYKYKGIQCVAISDQYEFVRAIYNSSFDADTVLKLAEGRVGEKNYHPFDNDDFDFARWCKTGQQEARVAIKTLILSADMLKPGDQVSWTRKWTYDHHALVKKVLSPNSIEVFEFTTRSGNKAGGKTYKKRTILPIFDGNDPVYKVTHTPAKDPDRLLEEAAKQEGDIGGYNPFDNNCENFAGNSQGCAAQARAFFTWLKELFTSLSLKASTSQLAGIFDDVIETVIRFSATAGAGVGGDSVVVYGLKCLTNSLHAIGFFIPFPIEFMMILWDINHDWADHKKTRIITGIIGTALTSLFMSALALLAVTIPVSIGLALVAIVVGVLGSTITNFVMRSIRRKTDQNKCREAFKGLYEDKPSQMLQFGEDVMLVMEKNMRNIDEKTSAMASKLCQAG